MKSKSDFNKILSFIPHCYTLISNLSSYFFTTRYMRSILYLDTKIFKTLGFYLMIQFLCRQDSSIISKALLTYKNKVKVVHKKGS